MIKESFLRNYSLSKIYSQAEQQRKHLHLHFLRKGTPPPTQSNTPPGTPNPNPNSPHKQALQPGTASVLDRPT